MGFHRECDDDGPPWQFSTQLLSIQSSFLDQVHYYQLDSRPVTTYIFWLVISIQNYWFDIWKEFYLPVKYLGKQNWSLNKFLTFLENSDFSCFAYPCLQKIYLPSNTNVAEDPLKVSTYWLFAISDTIHEMHFIEVTLTMYFLIVCFLIQHKKILHS